MGTGIVSIGFDLVGRPSLSKALLGIDLALWVGLCAVFGRRVLRQRARWVQDARTPASLTAVAGTAVLGARLELFGADAAAYALLVFALALWLGLVPPVLRHWRTPTVGVSFVLTVATESLAMLAALLALERRVAWLAVVALVPLALGIAGYVFVLVRLDPRQLLVGRGDHWVTGGALAITTLACARVAAAVAALPSLAGLAGGLADTALALWCTAALWLPALLVAEVAAPRPGYDTRRWSTVFPFGMYAVCSIAAGQVSGVGGIVSFGRAWIWVALVVWAVVCAGMVVRGVRLLRG